VTANGPGLVTMLPTVAGFALFFLMEQFLSWHHGHSGEPDARQPVTYLILLADGLHNFVGGLAVGASFVAGPQVGVITWIAAAAHEVPQELGDFGILVRGGWRPRAALFANFLSARTVLPGGLLAYYMSSDLAVTMLLSFAAGNFIYIAASDLIPEVKHDRHLAKNLVHFTAFIAGVSVIALTRALVGE
jgi:zinc and cadmium transporter